MNNPYNDLPETSFWKPSVALKTTDEILPVVDSVSVIGKGTKVATAGSCFAQKVSGYIKKNKQIDLIQSEAIADEQPLYSAKYGNIYTTRQLLQLFKEAASGQVDEECVVEREDGKYVDAFRPFMEKNGFDTAEEVCAERSEHLSKVRDLFTTMDVFIFTLGLTETWFSTKSGRVFPVCPGIYSKKIESYEFVNLGFSEIKADLEEFLALLKTVNPDVKVILTVSPVPLTATYTKDHVLTATMYSKSVLRTVCGEVVSEYDDVHYFPSFELVMNPFREEHAFEKNLRSVRQIVVDRVMQVFENALVDSEIHTHAGIAPSKQNSVSASNVSDIQPTEQDEPFCDDVEVEKSVGF